jgi:hypothetical protein
MTITADSIKETTKAAMQPLDCLIAPSKDYKITTVCHFPDYFLSST